MAAEISVRLTLYRLASALRLGSRQPGSRCTSAAAIRSASTPVAPLAPPAVVLPAMPVSSRLVLSRCGDAPDNGDADCAETGWSRPAAPAVISAFHRARAMLKQPVDVGRSMASNRISP